MKGWPWLGNTKKTPTFQVLKMGLSATYLQPIRYELLLPRDLMCFVEVVCDLDPV